MLKQTTTTLIHESSRYLAVEWDLSSVVPKNVTPEEAASIPIPLMTAVQALHLRLGIPEPPQKSNGEWILIWSGVWTNLPKQFSSTESKNLT